MATWLAFVINFSDYAITRLYGRSIKLWHLYLWSMRGGVETYTVANGIYARVYGEVVVLSFQGGANEFTLPANLRPSADIAGIVRGTTANNTRHVCLVTLTTSGSCSTSYFIPNSTTASGFTGSLSGSIAYTR